MTVAVGFIPRSTPREQPRRGATPEQDAGFSSVAPRRTGDGPSEPWLKSHGYLHAVAPRLPSTIPRSPHHRLPANISRVTNVSTEFT